jgi:CheY-like chemotaxis protein
MPLPQGFTLDQSPEEKPVGGLPAGFQMDSEAPPVEFAPRAAKEPALGFLGGAASLFDTTVGSVLPGVAQMMAYPLARLNRTAEEAQAITRRVVAPLENPAGRLLGVTETPLYQQEASRKLMNYVGQGAQKVIGAVSDTTGIAAPDVESYLGTLTPAVPAIARQSMRMARPALEQAAAGIQLPFEKQLQARREAASARDYERGPQIEAAADAQRLGVAISPENIQSTLGPKLLSSVAGEAGTTKIGQANQPTVRKIVLGELGLPLDRQLNGKAAYSESRALLSKPYQEIKALPIMAADSGITAALEALRPGADLITTDVSAKRINARIDKAIKTTSAGIDGTEVLRNIRSLREESSKIYGNKASPVDALERAQANIGIANTLEKLIENNITDPKLLERFRDSRSKLAKSFAYENATDFNTGIVDVSKLSRMTAKDSALTGDIAALARVAGNFPEAFSTSVTKGLIKPELKRTGLAGTLGLLGGYALGDGVGGALGAVLGAAGGEVIGSAASRMIASPGYQSGLSLRDMRLPATQAATAATQAAPSTAVVPYQSPVEVLMPGEGTYFPNYSRTDQPIYSTSFGQRALPNEIPKQVYEAQKNAELAQRYRSDDPSQSASYGQRRAYVAPEPTVGQALPVEPSVKTAASKVAAGKLFDMTAAEKVAWNKTKTDLQESLPALKALDSKALATKLADRIWVQETITKAKEKARGYAEIESRAANREAQSAARIAREKLEDTVQQLQDTLQARPTSRGGQGSVTRQFRDANPTNTLDVSFGFTPGEMRRR